MKNLLAETSKSLIGQKISSVSYAAIDYFDDKPYWDLGEVHEVEHGIEFVTNSNVIYQISWDDYPDGYGINLAKKSDVVFWQEAVIWDVTTQKYWQDVINRKITEIKFYWHNLSDLASLQDIEFAFDNNKSIWFSSSQFDREKKLLVGGSDDVSIVFSEPITYKYKIGNYTPEKDLQVEIINSRKNS